MESIYCVSCSACHRKCRHCHESRFRRDVGGALRSALDEAQEAFPKVIANLPAAGRHLDLNAPPDTAPGGHLARPGRIIPEGGEVLPDAVREEVLSPAREAIRDRYAGQGVRGVVQTAGDLVTPQIVDELLTRGVGMIRCAGMDDFPVAMEGDTRMPLHDRLRAAE